MKCFVCGKENSIYNELKFLSIDEPQPIKLDLFICDCGFAFYRHNEISKIYKENSKYVTNNTGSGAAKKFDVKRLGNSFSNVSSHLQPSNDILDIGCNNGVFLDILYQNGYTHLTGTDFAINREYTSELEQNGVKIYEASSLKSIPFNSKFDFITVNHVLEHVDNIDSFIKEIKDLLTTDGYLYIEVPDASRYIDNYFQPFSFFDLEHINHFSLDNLSVFLHKHGFQQINTFSFDYAMSDTINYPGIGILVKRQEDDGEITISEGNSKEKIEFYFTRSVAEISKYSYRGDFTNSIIYGVGANTLRTLGMLGLSIQNAKYFVDKNELFHGRFILDKEIKSIEFLSQDADQPEIVIFSKIYIDEITDDLRKRGILNTISSFF